MKYLPIHFSSSIWLHDNLWTNLNQFCVNIMELIVFITHIWLYGRFYISGFTCFCFFSPNLCCVPRLYIALFSIAIVAFGFGGAIEEYGAVSLHLYGIIFYCTIPRQLILHLHPYNILRFLKRFIWGTQFWVSRSKKCLVRKWQYLVFFRYFLTTYIIPFLSADVWKKTYKKRLFVSLFLFSF